MVISWNGRLATLRYQLRARVIDFSDSIDVILGFRNLFGLRGLGFEVRAGMFFPGKAWQRSDGSDPQMAAQVAHALARARKRELIP